MELPQSGQSGSSVLIGRVNSAEHFRHYEFKQKKRTIGDKFLTDNDGRSKDYAVSKQRSLNYLKSTESQNVILKFVFINSTMFQTKFEAGFYLCCSSKNSEGMVKHQHSLRTILDPGFYTEWTALSFTKPKLIYGPRSIY